MSKNPVEHVESGLQAVTWAIDHLIHDVAECEVELDSCGVDVSGEWGDFRGAVDEMENLALIARNALRKARYGE